MGLRRIKHQLQESAWLLGICEQGYDNLKTGRIHWIDNGKYKGKKWFADPFILDYDEKIIHLLVEEFDYKVHRGRIAKLTIDRNNWTVTDCRIILDCDTHLSFPMIWREKGHIYVCPENYKSGAWHIYEYDKEKEKLTYLKLLIKEQLTDAIMYKEGEEYYILSTFDPTPNGNHLSVYHSDSLLGEYTKVDVIEFEENIARNAGMIFKYQGKLIRPAQECNNTYGHALSFQCVDMKDGNLSFKEVYRFTSPHSMYHYGTHTYNEYKGMAVIDVKGKRYPLWGTILKNTDEAMIALHLKKAYQLK